MNLKNRAARVLSMTLVCALGLAPAQVAFAAPEEGDDAAEDESPEGEEAEGEEAEGEEAEGEEAEGEEAEGEEAEGEEAEGEEAEGEEAEGEGAEGEEAEGEEAEGEEAEGEEAEGEEAEDEEAEGEEAEDEEVVDEGPQRPEEPRWGPNKKYKLKGTGLVATGGAVVGVGVAGIVTSLLLTRCEVSDENGCTFGENVEQRTLWVPMSAVVAASGILLLGVGLSKRSKYKKWQNWSPESARVNVAPVMFAGGGGGVAAEGRF